MADVLLQIDPTTIEATKLLGTGSSQVILAAGLMFFVVVAAWLGRMLYGELKSCNAQMLDLTTKKIESDNKLAAALEGLERVVETAMRVSK